jgi:N-glycosylase/DNA lyase
MLDQCIPLPRLENAIREVCISLQKRRARKYEWDALSEDDLWRELVACILGSRVRYDVAYSAIERMDKASLFSGKPNLTRRSKYEKDVFHALLEPVRSGNIDQAHSRYPFPRLRASQISSAAETLYANRGTIRSILKKACDEREARRNLARDVAGLGPKQASLFLRNIGYTAHVAVLDVHVLTYMDWIGLTPSPVRAVRTLHQYETLEAAFIKHSCSLGFPPDHFDLAVWVVVRVAKKEYALCH